MSKTRLIILSVNLLFLLNSNAFIFAGQGQTEDNWQFSLAPFYLWAVNMSGEISMGPTTSPIDVEFSDVFDNLEAAFIVHFEAVYKSNWGVLLDINYLDLESDMPTPIGLTLNADLNMTLAELSGFYRVNRGDHSFDTIFGARMTKMDVAMTPQGATALIDDSWDWTDPLIGGRWIWNFADDWSLVARGDIGGFGVGSDFSWHALGTVHWQAFEHVSFLLGYRALDMDYEEGSGKDYFNFDATIHGPVIGLNINW